MINFSKKEIIFLLVLFSLILLISWSSSALASCSGNCGGYSSAEGCYCDEASFSYGDYCSDICVYCADLSGCQTCAPPRGCTYAGAATCQCDSACNDYGDCCADVCDYCDYAWCAPAEPTNCAEAGCGNYASGGNCWCDSACVANCDCCYDACSYCGYCDDPPSGTLSTNKTTVNVGETFTLTIAGNDDVGVNQLQAYYSGAWHAQICSGNPSSCTKSWTTSESTAGTYTYSGYVYDYDPCTGSAGQGAWTNDVTVTVEAEPTNCAEAGCGNYASGGNCWCDSACVANCDCCYDACSYCGYCDDPPSGTLSVSPNPATIGETITITITGNDDVDVNQLQAYYDGSWHAQFCDGTQTSCTKSWTTSESTAGTYTYKGYVYDTNPCTGSAGQGAWTTPSSIDVTVEANLPTVQTDPADNIEETTATLHGCITDTGGADTRARFQWGDTSSYGNNTNWKGYVTGPACFWEDLSSLTRGKTYHFRAQAQNSAGYGYGADETFITKPDPPSGFSATAVSASQIDLSWTRGSGAYYTMVRGKTGSYPTSPSDGTQVYWGPDTSVSHTGLTAGTTYYYRAWSRGYEEGYWSDYSDSYTSDYATTFSGVCSSLSYPTNKWQRVWYEYDPGTNSLTNCIGDGPDWTAETFDNNWGTDPVGGYREERIGFKSSRSIYFSVGGFYKICVGSDDGVKLWIDTDGDGSLEFISGLSHWADRSYNWVCNSALEIKGAGYHKFRIDYYENTNKAHVMFVISEKECKEECTSRGYMTWGSGCEYIEDFYIPTGGTCACPYEEISGYGCSPTCYCYSYIWNLSADSYSGSVAPSGDSVSATINVTTPCYCGSGSVKDNYVALGLPAGATAVFNPPSCELGNFLPAQRTCSSIMTISTASPVAEGIYTITITGTTHQKAINPITYTLTVEEKPDLIITGFSDANNDGIIEYTIKNQGDADADYSYTALYIDGSYTAYDYVASLPAGSSSSESFSSYNWKDSCTCPSDTIQVCADYYGPRIDESDEDNNCAPLETWWCDDTDPTVEITTDPLPQNGWHKGLFTAKFKFSDSGCSGLDICQYRVICGTSDTGWVSVPCSGDGPIEGSYDVDVGDGKWCSEEGNTACKTYGQAWDNAGNYKYVPKTYGIDYEAPTTEISP